MPDLNLTGTGNGSVFIAGGDSLTISVVDTVTFGHQGSDEALGRSPDGGLLWRVMSRATPGYANFLTNVEGSSDVKPERFSLDAPYPNPFNPSTRIRFRLPHSQLVTLNVYDLLGREIAILVNEKLEAGEYVRTFAAGNLASGVYLCRMQAGRYVSTAKLLLMK